jgi:hypothetical protein
MLWHVRAFGGGKSTRLHLRRYGALRSGMLGLGLRRTAIAPAAVRREVVDDPDDEGAARFDFFSPGAREASVMPPLLLFGSSLHCRDSPLTWLEVRAVA